VSKKYRNRSMEMKDSGVSKINITIRYIRPLYADTFIDRIPPREYRSRLNPSQVSASSILINDPDCRITALDYPYDEEAGRRGGNKNGDADPWHFDSPLKRERGAAAGKPRPSSPLIDSCQASQLGNFMRTGVDTAALAIPCVSRIREFSLPCT